MQFIMDMVHDNPGEARFNTAFRKPEKLLEFGYNTQVFRQNNTTVTFERLGEDFFAEEGGREWLSGMQKISENEIFPANKAGLMTMCHIDLFVLPKLLVEKYKDEICDENGRISIFKEKTKEIHRIMFAEMFERYPIDGLIIRVGETYLHDTPYHTGNGAVKYGDIEDEKKTFVELLRFLRDVVCVENNKYLIFRTWDCFPDRFHSDLKYYLDVTNELEPHEKLIFSMKFTALDFWRNVKFNPCIGEGQHKQVIEVQCQREYEGKGAYPMYVMDGVINGFKENKVRKGIKDVVNNPLMSGIFAWSRGGGWFGPYIKNEFWCDLNAYVICNFAQNPERDEQEIFVEYAEKYMRMDRENALKFHNLCLRSQDAVLHGRYITAYDKTLNESIMPSANWIRDDRIGGLRQLNEVFDYLEKNNLVAEALEEKKLAVDIWEEVKALFEDVVIPDESLKSFIADSIEYAIRFYKILYLAFKLCAECRQQNNVKELLAEYDATWRLYRELDGKGEMGSLYREHAEHYFNNPGINETVEYCRQNLC